MVTQNNMQQLLEFDGAVSGREFIRLYIAVGGSQERGEYLMNKWYNTFGQDILRTYAYADSGNRKKLIAMINKFSR